MVFAYDYRGIVKTGYTFVWYKRANSTLSYLHGKIAQKNEQKQSWLAFCITMHTCIWGRFWPICWASTSGKSIPHMPYSPDMSPLDFPPVARTYAATFFHRRAFCSSCIGHPRTVQKWTLNGIANFPKCSNAIIVRQGTSYKGCKETLSKIKSNWNNSVLIYEMTLHVISNTISSFRLNNVNHTKTPGNCSVSHITLYIMFIQF